MINHVQDEFQDDLLSDFLDESSQLIDRLNDNLLVLDEWAKHAVEDSSAILDAGVVNDMFRSAHSVKGLSAMLGLQSINGLTHHVENIFDAARRDELKITPQVVEIVFKSVDLLAMMLNKLRDNASDDVPCEAMIVQIQAVLNKAGCVSDTISQSDTEALFAAKEASRSAVVVGLDQAAVRAEVIAMFSGVTDEPEVPVNYVSIFIDDTELALEELGDIFDSIKIEVEEAAPRVLLATAHRIKTSAASIGLNRLTRLVHGMEDILQEIRTDKAVVSEALAEALLACIDAIQDYVQQLKDGSERTDDFENRTLDLLLAWKSQKSVTPEIEAPKVELPSNIAKENSANSPRGIDAHVSTIAAKQSIETSAAELERKSTLKDTQARMDKPAAAKPTETLRVDMGHLEKLMSLSGQLVANHARFEKWTNGLRKAEPVKTVQNKIENAYGVSSKLLQRVDKLDKFSATEQAEWNEIRSQIHSLHADLEAISRETVCRQMSSNRSDELYEAVAQLERISDDIQKCVIDIRMVRIGPLFGRFKRVVRDVSRTSGKDIRLKIFGENKRFDKRMIDELGDPLIHLVRNSADHGIESPEVRVANGKSPQGTIKLNAVHRGDRMIIQVTDDGKGLDPALILRKAIDKGIVDPANAKQMSNQQIWQLIWEPGFSTAEQITEISGRGMGMDIVRSKIENLNGVIDVDSTPGKGVTFTIELPLAMAILPSLLTRIHGETYAVPSESIVEIVRMSKQDFGAVQGVLTATIRGRDVTVVRLEELFENAESCATDWMDATDAIVVVIKQEGRELGLLVDDLLGEEDVIVKSIAENGQNILGFSGAGLRDDGGVALILNSAAIIDAASQVAGQQK